MADELTAFLDHFLAYDGPIDLGDVYTETHGWRAYLRVGDKGLAMAPRAFRKLGEKFRDALDGDETVHKLGRDMIEAANAAKAKNDRGTRPPTEKSHH